MQAPTPPPPLFDPSRLISLTNYVCLTRMFDPKIVIEEVKYS